MLKISLRDSEFYHINPPSHEGYDLPAYFSYDRENLNHDIIVFSEKHYKEVDNFKNKYKIAYTAESPVVRAEEHQWLINNLDKFDYIWTYNKKILDLAPGKAYFCPCGGGWTFKHQRKLYPKTKNVSIVASNKTFAIGHRFRHEIINKLKDKIDFIAGSGYQYLPNKLEAFFDYRFQVVIDNCNEPFFFTDKICDCYATGTVPLVWADSWIYDYFDKSGFFIFNTVEELSNILDAIRSDGVNIYNSMFEGVKKNLELVEQYVVPENYIYNTFIKNLIK